MFFVCTSYGQSRVLGGYGMDPDVRDMSERFKSF